MTIFREEKPISLDVSVYPAGNNYGIITHNDNFLSHL